jgi:hypothetical protein
MYRQKTGRRQYAQRPTANLLLGLPATSLRGVDFFHFFVPREGGCSGLPDPNFGFTESDHVAELKGIRGLNPARKIEDT